MLVVLDNIRSAHNVGSIIRTSDALEIKEIYFCGITPDPLTNEKVLKTSLGAEKNISVHNVTNIINLIDDLKNKQIQIIGIELNKNSIDISKIKPKTSCALIVGNEVSGLSEEIINKCDVLASIPMLGIKESLNVSVAFGIAAYVISNNIDS